MLTNDVKPLETLLGIIRKTYEPILHNIIGPGRPWSRYFQDLSLVSISQKKQQVENIFIRQAGMLGF